MSVSVSAAHWNQTMWEKLLKLVENVEKSGVGLVGEFFWRRFCLCQSVCVLFVALCLVLRML